jgi:CRP-like cAMP-binding protein
MQGRSARHLMMIQTGSAKVCQLSPTGNEVILWMAGAGDPLGVLVEALSQSYTCTAYAMTPTVALVWEYARIQALAAAIPQMRRNISQILTSRLDELQERFREVATEKVAPRVAKAIMRLLKQVGRPVSGGIELCLSREELAQMTGTTLFTISRLFSKWGEEGFVLPRREAVVVLDTQRLALVSNACD